MKEFFKYAGYGFIVLASLAAFITGLLVINRSLVCGVLSVVIGSFNFIFWSAAVVLDIINKK